MCTNETLETALYDKSYTCPLCNHDFKSKAIRSGKNKLLSTDIDLYAHYSILNPIFYDVITCPECGYTAIAKTMGPLLSKQKEWLRTQFYVGNTLSNYSKYPTLNETIHKHKLALLACITKKGKISEQAYIALLIAWLYRDAEDRTQELSFLERAFNGFKEAFSKEHFPMVGMDAPTITYLLAALAYEIGQIDTSKQYLSSVISTPDCPPRVKDRAYELKDIIKNHH